MVLGTESLDWMAECQLAFDTVKEKLTSAPALVLPNPRKPFKLYVHEKMGIGLRVLVQILGAHHNLSPTSLRDLIKGYKDGHLSCGQLQLPVTSCRRQKN